MASYITKVWVVAALGNTELVIINLIGRARSDVLIPFSISCLNASRSIPKGA